MIEFFGSNQMHMSSCVPHRLRSYVKKKNVSSLTYRLPARPHYIPHILTLADWALSEWLDCMRPWILYTSPQLGIYTESRDSLIKIFYPVRCNRLFSISPTCLLPWFVSGHCLLAVANIPLNITHCNSCVTLQCIHVCNSFSQYRYNHLEGVRFGTEKQPPISKVSGVKWSRLE